MDNTIRAPLLMGTEATDIIFFRCPYPQCRDFVAMSELKWHIMITHNTPQPSLSVGEVELILNEIRAFTSRWDPERELDVKSCICGQVFVYNNGTEVMIQNHLLGLQNDKLLEAHRNFAQCLKIMLKIKAECDQIHNKAKFGNNMAAPPPGPMPSTQPFAHGPTFTQGTVFATPNNGPSQRIVDWMNDVQPNSTGPNPDNTADARRDFSSQQVGQAANMHEWGYAPPLDPSHSYYRQ